MRRVCGAYKRPTGPTIATRRRDAAARHPRLEVTCCDMILVCILMVTDVRSGRARGRGTDRAHRAHPPDLSSRAIPSELSRRERAELHSEPAI